MIEGRDEPVYNFQCRDEASVLPFFQVAVPKYQPSSHITNFHHRFPGLNLTRLKCSFKSLESIPMAHHDLRDSPLGTQALR